MTLYLSKYLNKEHIESIKTSFGFTNPQIIEKFIMDFEMQYQISQELNCITRGGLCVPFHLGDHMARRLSEDIDLVTHLSLEQTKSIMSKLQGKLDDIRLVEHIPKDPKSLPLVTYRAHYTSCYGRGSSIKIDILCDTNINPQEIKTIPAGFEVIAFDTPGEISVLDHGSLIGDKLSTLSLSSPIGLDPHEDENSILKQLYDIGTLLKLITKDKTVQSFETFLSYTNLKIQRFQSKLSVNNIVTDIDTSLANLLQTSKQLALEKEYSKRFIGFKGNYLGNISYTVPYHISDILLIQLFNKSISLVQNRISSSDQAADNFTNQVNQVNQIQSIEDGAEMARVKSELLADFPSSVLPKKVLNGASPEHIFLMRELLNSST